MGEGGRGKMAGEEGRGKREKTLPWGYGAGSLKTWKSGGVGGNIPNAIH